MACSALYCLHPTSWHGSKSTHHRTRTLRMRAHDCSNAVLYTRRHVELLLRCLEERGVDIIVRQAGVDTLLVFLEIVDEARAWAESNGQYDVDGDNGGKSEDDPAVALGQHDLYRLTEVVGRLTKVRDRRASKGDNKRLRRTAERLLRILQRLNDDQVLTTHLDPKIVREPKSACVRVCRVRCVYCVCATQPEKEEEEEEEESSPPERLILRNSEVDPNTEVYQPELVVHSAWYDLPSAVIQLFSSGYASRPSFVCVVVCSQAPEATALTPSDCGGVSAHLRSGWLNFGLNH